MTRLGKITASLNTLTALINVFLLSVDIAHDRPVLTHVILVILYAGLAIAGRWQ